MKNTVMEVPLPLFFGWKHPGQSLGFLETGFVSCGFGQFLRSGYGNMFLYLTEAKRFKREELECLISWCSARLPLSPPSSGGGPGFCPVLAALPRGSLPSVSLPGRSVPFSVSVVRVLQLGVRGPLLSECRHQPHPLQHHVLEVQGRGRSSLRPGRQPTATRTDSDRQLCEGRRVERVDGVHSQLLKYSQM